MASATRLMISQARRTDGPDTVYDRALPAPRVWIVGAGHIAEHVAAFAARAGFAAFFAGAAFFFTVRATLVARRCFAIRLLTGWIRADSNKYCSEGSSRTIF